MALITKFFWKNYIIIGFAVKYLDFLSLYLAARQVCTEIDGKISSPRLVEYGVPQGSILGSLFFMSMTFACYKFWNYFFADDTNLHLCHSNINTLRSYSKCETVKINDWMSYNKLTINYKKSYFMLVSKRPLHNCNIDIFINHEQIEKTEYVKYLGVFLDDRLTWKHHIDYVIKKISKVCGMIHKLRYYVRLSTLKLVYYSIILYFSHIFNILC